MSLVADRSGGRGGGGGGGSFATIVHYNARVNALCNLSAQEVARGRSVTSEPISELALLHAVYNNGN